MNIKNIGEQSVSIAKAGKVAKIIFKGYNKEKVIITVEQSDKDFKIKTRAFGIEIEKILNEFETAREIKSITKDMKDAEGMKTKDGMEIYCN